jgi:ferredoxin-NADP reductase
MTIQITKTETKDIEVPVPSFWKSNIGNHTAIIDEQTAVHFYVGKDYTSVQHGTPEELKERIEIAHRIFDLCTETEFMEAYNKTLKSLSLQPELV